MEQPGIQCAYLRDAGVVQHSLTHGATATGPMNIPLILYRLSECSVHNYVELIFVVIRRK